VVIMPPGSEPASGSDSAKAGDHSPLAQRGQDALLELVAAEQADGERPELLHHQDQRGRGAGLRDLLDRDVEHQRAGAGPPYSSSNGKPEQVLLGEQLAQVPRVLGLGVISLARGATRSRTIWRIVSRKATWSSDSAYVVSGGVLVAMVGA
jgi:hypothetical protein